MTIWYLGNGVYEGESKDKKPVTPVQLESYFIELDTGTRWKWNGTEWFRVHKRRKSV